MEETKMRGGRFKQRLRDGQSLVGSVVGIPDPLVAEIMAAAHFDFLIIDTEHCPLSIYQLQTLLIALQSGPAPVIVRAPWNDPVAVKQILDVGADGIIFPWINSRADCEAAAASARYPPVGIRGFGPRRASRLAGSLDQYVQVANEEVVVLAQIERGEALENLDEILTTPGLDGIMVGPADLACSLGYTHDREHPAVEQAIQRILDGCRKHGVPFGMFTQTIEKARLWLGRGGQIATLGGDLPFIDAGIARARQEITALLGRN